MIQQSDIQNIFFLGIGGIGMSALARFFHTGDRLTVSGERIRVCGYDRTPSELTHELEKEGMTIIYNDSIEDLRLKIGDLTPSNTLVVRTPAVPEDSAIYTYLREQGFDIRKRAEVLGMLTRTKKALCVAGTHGKTTTSTMIAHLMNGDGSRATGDGINAFLGGISMNYHTNLLIDPESEYVVVEADEYDRSFHHLTPYISVVTAVDADHLDIYGTPEAYREAFVHYTSLITGALVMKHSIELEPRLQPGVKCYTYGVKVSGERLAVSGERPDFYADAIKVEDGQISFDFHTPTETVSNVRLGVPVWVNIENAVAALAVCYVADPQHLLSFIYNLSTFKGVWRRFNIHVNTPRVAYVDDYAHHPQEIATAIDSVRKLYPNRTLIGVFQPHLYTRTRDFASEFARVLHTMDELILLPIYPAREEPIPGVSSEMLLKSEGVKELRNERVVQKADLVAELKQRVADSTEPVVILTVGAGDIDRLVPDITKALKDERMKG